MKISIPFPGVYETALIDSWIPGPSTVVFSWIHGDETSWMEATSAFFDRLLSREVPFLKGTLALVFVGNEEAAWAGKRYVRHNLNRCFRDDLPDDGSYERRRAVELKKILDTADYFLDLHSTSGPSVPFLFSERKNLDFAKKLDIPHVIVGWNDLSSDSTAWDTENYANRRGMGFTFESWNHDDPQGERNATRALLNFLAVLEQVPQKYFEPSGTGGKSFSISRVQTAETDDFRFKIDTLDNFTPIRKGTLVATDGGKGVLAEEDFILVMPNLAKIKAGEDAFFYWALL